MELGLYFIYSKEAELKKKIQILCVFSFFRNLSLVESWIGCVCYNVSRVSFEGSRRFMAWD